MGNRQASVVLGPVGERIASWIAAGAIDGAAVAVAVGGEPIAEDYYGNAAPDRAASADTLWPLGSVSKLYTAAAVMALVERGDLTLATRVHELLPDFAGDGREAITLRHLLTHTSGLIYESPRMEELLREQTPPAGLLAEAYTSPLRFPPGMRFAYSDYGYALAGELAAAATGQTFPALVRDLVLDPAGLRDTFMLPPPAVHARLARVTGAFAEDSEGAMYVAPYALALAHPAFGTIATLRDLLRFGLLFAPGGRDRLLSAATIRAMTTDQTGGAARGRIIEDTVPDLAPPRPWGLGFQLRAPTESINFGDLASPASFGHYGATGCLLLIDPAVDLTIAVVSNRHALSNPDAWSARLTIIVNGLLAAFTRDHA